MGDGYGDEPDAIATTGTDGESDDIVSLDKLKRMAVEKAYRACDGNVDRAAVELGIGRATMYRLLKRYRIMA